jgi:hypothetical protein
MDGISSKVNMPNEIKIAVVDSGVFIINELIAVNITERIKTIDAFFQLFIVKLLRIVGLNARQRSHISSGGFTKSNLSTVRRH